MIPAALRCMVTCVAAPMDRYDGHHDASMLAGMEPDLAPLRHAHQLLQHRKSVVEVIDDLRWTFALSFVDAMAAVAACVALTESGLSVSNQPFARPFV